MRNRVCSCSKAFRAFGKNYEFVDVLVDINESYSAGCAMAFAVVATCFELPVETMRLLSFMYLFRNSGFGCGMAFAVVATHFEPFVTTMRFSVFIHMNKFHSDMALAVVATHFELSVEAVVVSVPCTYSGSPWFWL